MFDTANTNLIDEAELKFTQGSLEAAVSNIEEALKIHPNCDDAYLDLGLIYLRAQRMEDTLKAFKRAVEINPRMITVIKQIPKPGLAGVREDFLKKL
jgi:Tfp pilus assembly protein PilF